MIKEIQGNLFDSTAQILGHGVNCLGAMASGIAVEFKNRYPEMHEDYLVYCEEETLYPGAVMLWKERDDHYVANIASQYYPGSAASYHFALTGLDKVVDVAQQNDIESIAIPRIGCGVGGLDWQVMQRELYMNYDEIDDVTIEVWSL